MKKEKFFSILIVTLLLISSTAFAASDTSYESSINSKIVTTTTRASSYLEGYGISLIPKSNSKIQIVVSVDGTGKMNRIGIRGLYIEQKINGNWTEFESVYGAEHPEFYEHDSTDYLGSYSFYGTSGVQYRVTATAFASKGYGWDTGSVTSYVETCK